MKNFLLLLSISLFVSCEMEERNTFAKTKEANDSTLFHYNISKDKTLSLDKRAKAVNTAFLITKKNNKDTLYRKVLYQKNLIHLALREYDSLRIFNRLLIENAQHFEDARTLGGQHYLMGYYFAEIAKTYDSAFSNYNLSKSYFERIGDRSWVGKNLLNMGTIQKDQNDHFGSKETLTEALQNLSIKKDLSYIASCYNILGTNHRKLLNYADAQKYYRKAIETTGSDKDKLIYQNNLAATLIDNKQYQVAIDLLEILSQNATLPNNPKEYARVLDNLAYAQWLSEGMEKVETFLEPLNLRVENNDKRGQIASHTHLGEFYSKRNPKKARSHFDSAIRLSRILKIPKAEKDVLKFLMQLEPDNVSFRNRYVHLQDSLYREELQVKTQFAKYKYDDKLKLESILRLENENAEKELEVARQRNQKILSYSLGGLLLLLLGFAVYFFVQRTKRLKHENRTAKLEATYQTEEELSRRLHDDFGGQLNHTMLLLQNGTDTSEILDTVERLYNQSRDFSRKINDVDTGPNFKNLLFGMLGTYSENTKLVVTGSKEIDWGNISAWTKKTLYRALHELMGNMEKHSRATLVNIDFEQTKKMLKVDYQDNGIGATKDNLNNRNGLWNTEKRIQAIGGTIIFDSQKGNGFKAQIEIPN